MKSGGWGLLFFLGFILVPAPLSWAHRGETHEVKKAPSPDERLAKAMQEIAASYDASVQSIFRSSCMDCHSDSTRYPWYSKLPLIKQMIETDINEAREHLDMSGGFPFKSHASPREDLESIGKTIKDGEMPPPAYRFMHPGARLSSDEKAAVLRWVEASLFLLDEAG